MNKEGGEKNQDICEVSFLDKLVDGITTERGGEGQVFGIEMRPFRAY